MTGEPKQVVILGAGFGGLYAARGLRHADIRLTVIDRRNHHTFQPLLYQVATAGLNPSDIASPIRHVLRHQKNAEVILAEATAIDADAKKVILRDGEIAYDMLIVAVGATHSYFGHDKWAARAPGLKSLEDALEIRRRVFFAFEAAERETDPEIRRAYLTFVIIGAGATGVELAGVLAEIAHHTLTGDFRRFDPRDARIILLEGTPRVLPTYVESLSERAREQLKSLGVEVRTGTRVTDIDERGVVIGDERIDASVVLWAAGVAASPLARTLGVPLDRAGRVLVKSDLTIPGHDDVYVIGDLAALEQDGSLIPGVAPAAIQEGIFTAKNIERALRAEPPLAFRYHDKGSIATIGRAAAIADFGRLKLSGFVAWLAWFLVHIFFLIGFRNRFLVMFEWAWSYLTFERGARLITGNPPPPLPAMVPKQAETPARKGDGDGQRRAEL